MNVKMMKVNKLKPAPYNPRVKLTEDDREFQSLKEGITKYGFVQPVVWNKRTGFVVGGHQRLEVAKALGYTEVPVHEVDLDDADEKKLNLALNKVSGKWNEEALGLLLADLKAGEEDLDVTGFDEIEIEELTLAFSDVSYDDLLEDLEREEELPMDGDEEEEEDFENSRNDNNYSIQYNVVFDDEVQQETFHTFLKLLKQTHDKDAFPSISSRIHAYLVKSAIPELEKRAQENE